MEHELPQPTLFQTCSPHVIIDEVVGNLFARRCFANTGTAANKDFLLPPKVPLSVFRPSNSLAKSTVFSALGASTFNRLDWKF